MFGLVCALTSFIYLISTKTLQELSTQFKDVKNWIKWNEWQEKKIRKKPIISVIFCNIY